MSKIVPGLPRADLGLYDESDEAKSLFDFLTSTYGQYRDSQQRVIGDLDDSLSTLLTNMPNMSSEDSINAVGESLKFMNDKITSTGNAELRLKYNIADASYKDSKSQFNAFETNFNKIVDLYQDEDSFLNPKNMQRFFDSSRGLIMDEEELVANPDFDENEPISATNQENIKNLNFGKPIKSLVTPELIAELADEMRIIQNNIAPGGTILYPNYTSKRMNKNQENINTKTAYAYFQDMNNTLVNWAQAMDKNGIVSFEEFRFIAQGLSSEQIDGMRTNIVRDTKTQMQNNLTASLKIDATLMAIEENQNKYISELIAGEGGDEATE